MFTAGRADRPAVLLVHGYPDDHRVWDTVAAELSGSMRLVAYDVRGAGESARPDDRRSYRLTQLARDVDAVADSVGGPVHLLAHDWGSVQAWRAVTGPDATSHYLSFTSISGPALSYSAHWYRQAWHRGARRPVLRQARASWYIGLFLLPWLPERLWRAGVLSRLLGSHGRCVDVDTAVAGLALYRANVRAGGAPRPCRVPTLVLAPRHDRYITAQCAQQAPVPWTPMLQTQVIDGGHWGFVDHPDRVVTPVRRFVGGLAAPPSLTD